MDAVTNIASSQEEIDAAYDALLDALNDSPAGLPGDADCSGDVTFTDISIIYSLILGSPALSEQGVANADFNGDGYINFTDVSLLYSYLLGA